uniref:Uncharacterized protein n=1 Tax=Sphaerodactylus townsendi TaxID=933632 RepID=A0ACB8EGP5_9SAUR
MFSWTSLVVEFIIPLKETFDKLLLHFYHREEGIWIICLQYQNILVFLLYFSPLDHLFCLQFISDSWKKEALGPHNVDFILLLSLVNRFFQAEVGSSRFS